MVLPPYMLVISFGLDRIAVEDGALEIAPGTHRLAPADALAAVETGIIRLSPVPLEIGDVLIRHPWALHRGTPNVSNRPRVLVSIRYVRRWYPDASREVSSIPRSVWQSLTPAQRDLMRFAVRD